MVEVDVGGVAAADVRMLQRPAVHFLFGDLRQLVDECLHSDPLRNQLTQRFLQKKKTPKNSILPIQKSQKSQTAN